jgi:hypothetical protein
MSETAVVTTEVADGKWKKGQSGNPAGRPLSNRNKLLEHKQTLEGYIRGRIDKEKAVKAVLAMVDAAADGNVKAAATILPYILSKATDEDEDAGSKHPGGIVIRIENATVKAKREEITEGEFKEITNDV